MTSEPGLGKAGDMVTMTAPAMSRPQSMTDQVAGELRRKILAGDFGDDGKLPSEADLTGQYHVSRQVTGPVYRQLIAEGLVVALPRKGYYVHRINPITLEVDYERGDGASGRDGLDQWERAVADQNRIPRTVVTVYMLDDDELIGPMVRELLKAAPDDEVVVRDRVCYVDDTPFMLRHSFFPLWLASGTILMKHGDQVAPGGLLAAIGRPAATWRNQMRARMPTPLEADRLALPQVTPGIHWIRTRLDADGVPLAVMSAFLPGDRVQLAETIDAG